MFCSFILRQWISLKRKRADVVEVLIIYYRHVRWAFWSVWDVCGELLHASFSLRLYLTFMASTCFQTLLRGPKVSLLHQEMYAIQQSAAYGGKSASKANQEWRRRRRHSSCKHAMWSTISSAVRNLMIKTDRMLSAFQPAASETFICGGWGMGGRGGGIFLGGRYICPDEFLPPSFKFLFHFHASCSDLRSALKQCWCVFSCKGKTSCFDV